MSCYRWVSPDPLERAQPGAVIAIPQARGRLHRRAFSAAILVILHARPAGVAGQHPTLAPSVRGHFVRYAASEVGGLMDMEEPSTGLPAPAPPAQSTATTSGSATLVELLPEALLYNCLQRLPLPDVRRCAAVCRALRRPAVAVESEVHHLTRPAVEGHHHASPVRYEPGPTFANLPHLVCADLRGARWVNSHVLAALAAHCPRLTDLNLSRCVALDQHAALALRHSRSLVEVDFAFCPMIRFTVAAQLRRAVPSLRVVRRLPSWLTGVFHCPWGEDHSYWPDGSFSFTRATQSRGAVHELEEYDDGAFLKDALIYTDGPAWLGRGPQQGVFLRMIERDELPEAERWPKGDRNQVLVAQSMEHWNQLSTFPDVAAAEVPLTDSVRVSAPGMDGREITAMVSRMQVDPLPDDGQPPASLQHELDNAAIDDNVFEPDQSEGASQATTITQAIAVVMQEMGIGVNGGHLEDVLGQTDTRETGE